MNLNTAPTVYWIDNPFRPEEAEKAPVLGEMTIQQWVDANGGESRLNALPVVCHYQGRQLMRAEYSEHLITDDVCFVALPQGGGGSNPLAFIAIVALSVVTFGAAAAMGAGFMMGASVTTGALVGLSVGMGLASLAIGKPDMPSSATAMTGSPTYSMGAQGNQARLGDPIPVVYGKTRVFPPFAAMPYTEYDNNEQYLYQLFAITQGQCSISDIKLADTPVANYSDVEYQVIEPGQPVTLFHTAVVTASEAGGQSMDEPVTHGPYAINSAGTELTRVGVDVVFPSGLMGVNDQGDEYSVGVHLTVTAAEIDDAGKATGQTVSIFNSEISGRTRTAVRRTLAADVPAGRYQVTIQRTTGKGGSREIKNCQLGAVRGYMPDTTNYGDITMVAMRIRASANLSDQSSREINMVVQRLIPAWSRANGWSQPVASNSPVWAFADIVRSRYGADMADSSLDLDGLEYLESVYSQRGDEFNAVFDTESNCWEALTKVSQVGRALPCRQGNLVRMVRDQLETAHSGAFSMANVSDLSIDYVMPSERTSDSVKATYWSKDKGYKQQTVLCELPGETGSNPEEVNLFGCTDHNQAWREGMYLAASNRERRVMVSFKTGQEGYIPTYGSIVLLNHDLLGGGKMFSGYAVGAQGDELILGNDVTLTGGSWYISTRDRAGKMTAPQIVTQTGANRVRVSGKMPTIVTRTDTDEPTHYMIGQGANWSKRVKVTSVQPAANDTVKVSGFIEEDSVHSADSGTAPPVRPDYGLPTPAPGKVEDLRATQGGTKQQPVIHLSWKQAPNSERYLIEYSKDAKATWQPAGTGNSYITEHSFGVDPGQIVARVAGIGALRGEWTEISLNAGGNFDTPQRVAPVLSEPFTGNDLKIHWAAEPAAARYLVHVVSGSTVVRALYLDRSITSYDYSYLDAQRDAAGRTITVKVRAQNANNVDGDWGEVTATNQVPAVPANVVVSPLVDAFTVKADQPAETDLKEFRVYASQTAGFTPAPDNMVYAGESSFVSLNLKGDWHFRTAWVDNWSDTGLNYSGEVTATSASADLSDIEKDLSDLDNKIGTEIGRVEAGIVDINTDLTGVKSGLSTETTERKAADASLLSKTTSLKTETDDNAAAIQAETTARTTSDTALGKRIDKVVATTGANSGAIQTEITARTDADTALGQRIDTVQAKANGNESAIQTESTARATADTALGKRIDTVTAKSDANEATIQSETTARATADAALGKRVDTVQATANGNSASVQAHSTAISNVENGVTKLEAAWGVKMDVNGYCSGFEMNNNGQTSSALFKVDTFAVGAPGTTSLTFAVDDGKVVMPGVSIQDGTIAAKKLNVSELSAISANLGHATAGTFETSTDINGNRIVISSTGNIPFFAGSGAVSMENAKLAFDKSGNLVGNNARLNNGYFSGSINASGDINGASYSGGNITGATIEGSVIIATGTFTANSKDSGSGVRFFYNPYAMIESNINNTSGGDGIIALASYDYTKGGTDSTEYSGNTVTYYKPINRLYDETMRVDATKIIGRVFYSYTLRNPGSGPDFDKSVTLKMKVITKLIGGTAYREHVISANCIYSYRFVPGKASGGVTMNSHKYSYKISGIAGGSVITVATPSNSEKQRISIQVEVPGVGYVSSDKLITGLVCTP